MSEDLLNQVEAAAGLAVYGAAGLPGVAQARAELAADGVPGLLTAKDPTLWGPDAEPESKIRLGWLDTFRRSRDLLPQIAELRSELSDLDNVVLAGMGGSSLAPEVITRTLGRKLTVLDTTDPGQVRAALTGGAAPGSAAAVELLKRTVVVVSSKSGSTVETDSHRRAYLQAFLDAGLSETEAGRHFVIVTDPGSPLAATGRQMGAYVVLADPEVGGRYSALTAFGLVPSALAGVDVAELLDQADALAAGLGEATDNPAFVLGVALGVAARDGRDKLALVEDGTGIVGLADWIEQLVAESTGKLGRGILPVVVETPDAPGATGADVLTASIGGSLPVGAVPGGGIRPQIAVNGPLGAHFLAWEFATAIAGRVLGINPFDQPNVQESKDNTNRILAQGRPDERATLVDGAVEVYGAPGAGSLSEALESFLGQLGSADYLAVMAYLDRFADAPVAEVRALLARRTGRPVTFGWGPRFLHSTGQYHKGGPAAGRFLQITGVAAEDLAVPGRAYSFAELQAAQAAGDRVSLAQHSGNEADAGAGLLWLHLTDRAAGIAQLLQALR